MNGLVKLLAGDSNFECGNDGKLNDKAMEYWNKIKPNEMKINTMQCALCLGGHGWRGNLGGWPGWQWGF